MFFILFLLTGGTLAEPDNQSANIEESQIACDNISNDYLQGDIIIDSLKDGDNELIESNDLLNGIPNPSNTLGAIECEDNSLSIANDENMVSEAIDNGTEDNIANNQPEMSSEIQNYSCDNNDEIIIADEKVVSNISYNDSQDMKKLIVESESTNYTPNDGIQFQNNQYCYFVNNNVDHSVSGLIFNDKLYDIDLLVTGGNLNYNPKTILEDIDNLSYEGDYKYVNKSMYHYKYYGKPQEYYYFKDGVLQKDFTGFFDNKYIVQGKWIEDYTGIADGNFVCKGEKSDYTGIIGYFEKWYYVKNGKVNNDFTGLISFEGCQYYIENGIVDWNKTGITNDCLVEKGVVSQNYTGLTSNKDDALFIKNGKVNNTYSGLAGQKNTYNKKIVNCGEVETNKGLNLLGEDYYFVGNSGFVEDGYRQVEGCFLKGNLLLEYPGTSNMSSYNSGTLLAIQKRLNQLGYKCSINGKYSNELVSVITKFQKDRLLNNSNGAMRRDTWNSLFLEYIKTDHRILYFDEGSYKCKTVYEELVDNAYSQVGYETNSSSSAFGQWYGMKNAEWCNIFCTWVAEKTGVVNLLVPTGHYTETTKKWFLNQGAFEYIEYGYIPKPGDQIYYREITAENWRTVTHVGIVAYCDGTTLITVEGNKYKYWPDGDIREVGEYTWQFQKEQYQRDYEIIGFGNIRKVAYNKGLNSIMML